MPVRKLVVLTALILAATLLRAPFPQAEGQNEQKTAKLNNASQSQQSYGKNIQPLMEKYCTSCHGGKRPRADLNLELIETEAAALAEKAMWQKVATMLRAGEMPPPTKPRPNADEIDKILNWIDHDVYKINCDGPVNPGSVTLRRLNKAEYNNTIRDLLGIEFNAAKDFPDDDVGYGFDNIGDVLSLSPLLLENYLKASEEIVKRVWNDPQAKKKILIRTPQKTLWKPGATVILKNFASRAYRRPVTDAEVERLLKFVELARSRGDSVENGIKLAVQATLVSPHFLFRVEKDQVVKDDEVGHYITDYELASRLSYFLWSSMPDAELFQLAEKKQLRQKETLQKQVKRMLADVKAKALVENFAGQWLQLRNLRKHAPDPDHFPDWDEALRRAMIEETELFFETIMKDDRSILDFLDADFTFVNQRLAKHYGLQGIKGEQFQRINLKNHVRGGLLTHASILTVTSNPTRTSPVLRGKWILENLLNAPPPPPPPNAGELSEDKAEILKGSLRQRMEMHRKKPECATCHNRMDPLGFGLENFDGIGGWRTKDGKFDIDAFGELPTGEKFDGPKELRAVLVKSKAAEFRRCLVEKMLTYALGRGLEYYDRCAVDDICEALAENDNRFSVMINQIVQSDPFLKRKRKKGGSSD